MRRSCHAAVFFALATALFTAGVPNVEAAAKSGAELLPETTVVYAEIASPADVVAALRQHPVHKRLQRTEEYKRLTEENPDYLKARAGVGIFEFVVGRDWDQAIADIAGEGLYFGVDAKTQGAVVLAHAPDADTLVDIRDRLIQAAKDDARRKGKEVEFEEHDYRGHTVYKTDKAIAGVIDGWLIVTNKPELGRAVADNLLDGADRTLAANEKFSAARRKIAGDPIAWAYYDVQTLRDAGVAKRLYKDKSDNPGVELLLGGILATLNSADSGTAAMYLEKARLRIAFQMPHDPASLPEERGFYFGKDGRGAAPAPLSPNNALLTATAYRDVGEMWRRRSDLFDENVNAELAQADSNLSTVFAGLDFGREVLGALEPEVQIISTAQDFEDHETRVPKIKLPATALVFQLKEPEKMQRQLKVSFQSLIGLTNLGAGQNELPQLELKTEKVGDGQIISATYENLPDDAEVSNDIVYNFSPSLAFVGENFIVSSTRELAVELMGLAARDRQPLAEGERIVNTQVTLNSDVLHAILADNREALIAQNMLEEGHTRKEAEKQIDALLALLKFAGDATAELATGERSLQLELALGLDAE